MFSFIQKQINFSIISKYFTIIFYFHKNFNRDHFSFFAYFILYNFLEYLLLEIVKLIYKLYKIKIIYLIIVFVLLKANQLLACHVYEKMTLHCMNQYGLFEDSYRPECYVDFF